MALDEREYILARQGWDLKKLKGFRRSVKQENQDDYDYWRRIADRQKFVHVAVALIIFIAVVLSFAFRFWH